MTLRGRHCSCLAALATLGIAAGPPPAVAQVAAGATPDTTLVEFLPAGTGVSPVAVHVLADTVSFGGVLAVAWDLPAGSDAAGFKAPVSKGEQFVSLPSTKGADGPGGAGAGLPPAAGPRVVARYRVYAPDFVQLSWKGVRSGTVAVKGRVTDPSRAAAIRAPRPLAWFTWTLAAVLLAAIVVAAGAWWLWRRLHRRAEPADWPLPEPAWMAAALDCRDLLALRLVEKGESRAFLDGLAGVARRLAAGHFGVAGAEMTGVELQAACAERGHDPALPGALARLLDGADLRRYDPAEPSPQWCREQALDLVRQIAAVRVVPRLTPVAPERLLAAQSAWAELTSQATGGGR